LICVCVGGKYGWVGGKLYNITMEGESLVRLQSLLGDKERLMDAITKLLGDLLSETQGLPRQATAFDCKQIPAIAIRDYLRRTSPSLRHQQVRQLFRERPGRRPYLHGPVPGADLRLYYKLL
jgi:hypothetical protein